MLYNSEIRHIIYGHCLQVRHYTWPNIEALNYSLSLMHHLSNQRLRSVLLIDRTQETIALAVTVIINNNNI